MSAPIIWSIYMGLSVIGVIGYDIAVKYGTEKSNVFSFMVLLTFLAFIFHSIAFGIHKYAAPETDILLSQNIIILIIIAALGLLALNFGFFYAVKLGGLIKTNAVWLVGSLVLGTIIGALFFREEFDYNKTIGVICGIAAVYFLVK